MPPSLQGREKSVDKKFAEIKTYAAMPVPGCKKKKGAKREPFQRASTSKKPLRCRNQNNYKTHRWEMKRGAGRALSLSSREEGGTKELETIDLLEGSRQLGSEGI